MRTINTDEISKNIKEMCIEANLSLTEDMKCRFKNATENEKNPLGKQILNQLRRIWRLQQQIRFNLPGYRNGNRIFKYRTGCSH